MPLEVALGVKKPGIQPVGKVAIAQQVDAGRRRGPRRGKRSDAHQGNSHRGERRQQREADGRGHSGAR